MQVLHFHHIKKIGFKFCSVLKNWHFATLSASKRSQCSIESQWVVWYWPYKANIICFQCCTTDSFFLIEEPIMQWTFSKTSTTRQVENIFTKLAVKAPSKTFRLGHYKYQGNQSCRRLSHSGLECRRVLHLLKKFTNSSLGANTGDQFSVALEISLHNILEIKENYYFYCKTYLLSYLTYNTIVLNCWIPPNNLEYEATCLLKSQRCVWGPLHLICFISIFQFF